MTDVKKIASEFEKSHDKALLKGITEGQLREIINNVVRGGVHIKAIIFSDLVKYI